MRPILLPPLPFRRALLLTLALPLAVLTSPGIGLGMAALSSDCLGLTMELREYCASHPDAGQAEFDQLCRDNAAIAFCNCIGISCVTVVEPT
jgi:hypothetical protein